MIREKNKSLFFTSLFFIHLFYGWTSSIAQETGFLKFELNIDSVVVVIDRDILTQQTVAAGDSIELVTGTHFLEVFPPFDNMRTSYIFVFQDSTTSYNYHFRKDNINKKSITGNLATEQFLNKNLILITDHDSEIYIENELLGKEFESTKVVKKEVLIHIKNLDFGTKKIRFQVGESISLIEHYRRPKMSVAHALSVFPGASQIYKDQYLKGGAFTLLNISLTYFSIKKSIDYSNEEKLFFELNKKYRNAINEVEAYRLGELASTQQKEVSKLHTQKRLFLTGAIIAYAFNLYDGITNMPNGGYRKKKSLDVFFSSMLDSESLTGNATIQVNF